MINEEAGSSYDTMTENKTEANENLFSRRR